MLSKMVRFAAVLLTIALLGPSHAEDVATGQKLEFRRVGAKKAVDFAPLHASWGVVRNLDEAVEACLETGFIEDVQVAHAGAGKVRTVEPDGTEVEIEIIGGGAGGGGSATPVGRMVEGERRARVAALLQRLGLKLPTQSLILLPADGDFRVHEMRIVPATKEAPRRLIVDVRQTDDQPADEVVIVPRAIPVDAMVVFVNGAEDDRQLAVIGGDISAGPRPPAGG
jgi:hypothetical protein